MKNLNNQSGEFRAENGDFSPALQSLLLHSKFMKRTSIAEVTKEAHNELAKHSNRIAKAEGLYFHAESVVGEV